MDKRYQVFVSSTYEDLKKEREEVIRALLELDCIPVGMELFPAADDDAWTLIKRVIDDSDYYIVISAGRYGSVHPETNIGFTEMEYDYALHAGKPALAFLHADRGSIPSDRCENEPRMREKLEAFRDKMRRKVTKEWNDARDLGAVASRGIVQLMRQKPGVGWIRADRAASDEAKLENLQLSAEVNRLESLFNSSADELSKLKTDSSLIEKCVDKIYDNPAERKTLLTRIISTIEDTLGVSYQNKGEFESELVELSLTGSQIKAVCAALVLDGAIYLDDANDYILTDAGRNYFQKVRLKAFLED